MYNQAYFAGGCFWCTESIFRIVKGVTKIIPGYMGGHLKNPAYSEVCNGNTGHTEAIKITYDQDLVTYGDLLEIFFLTHDPTTPDRQGNDVGSQYRSAIFFNNFEEKIQIENCINSLQNRGAYDKPIITEVNSKCAFYEAEVVHHNYYNQNKEKPYCQFVIAPKIKKFQSLFQNSLNIE